MQRKREYYKQLRLQEQEQHGQETDNNTEPCQQREPAPTHKDGPEQQQQRRRRKQLTGALDNTRNHQQCAGRHQLSPHNSTPQSTEHQQCKARMCTHEHRQRFNTDAGAPTLQED
jgi:hypothetical protein